jgi:hypothetical protein
VSTSNISLHDNLFDGCQSDNGGAVNLDGTQLDGSIDNCNFLNCRATSNGGAVWFYGFRLLLSQSSFLSNSCNSDGSAVHATQYPSNNVDATFTQSAFIGGFCRVGSCYVEFSSVSFDHTNITRNSVSLSQSAVCLDTLRGSSLEFCFIESNEHGDCLGLFHISSYTAQLHCITLRHNSCDSCWECTPQSHGALFLISGDCNVTDSVLLPNSVYWLIYGISDYPTATFTGCWYHIIPYYDAVDVNIITQSWYYLSFSPTVMPTCDGPLPSGVVLVMPEGMMIVVYVCVGVIGTIVCIVGLIMCCKKSVIENEHTLRPLSSVYAGLPNEGGMAGPSSGIPSVDGRAAYSAQIGRASCRERV